MADGSAATEDHNELAFEALSEDITTKNPTNHRKCTKCNWLACQRSAALAIAESTMEEGEWMHWNDNYSIDVDIDGPRNFYSVCGLDSKNNVLTNVHVPYSYAKCDGWYPVTLGECKSSFPLHLRAMSSNSYHAPFLLSRFLFIGVSPDGTIRSMCTGHFGEKHKNVALIVGRFRLLCFLVNSTTCALTFNRQDAIRSRSEKSGLGEFIRKNKEALSKYGYPAHVVCSLPHVSSELVDYVLDLFSTPRQSQGTEKKRKIASSETTSEAPSTNASLAFLDVAIGSENVYPNDLIGDAANPAEAKRVLQSYKIIKVNLKSGLGDDAYSVWALSCRQVLFVNSNYDLERLTAENLCVHNNQDGTDKSECTLSDDDDSLADNNCA